MPEHNEKILLADDEHDILMLVNFHLQRAGYQVILAALVVTPHLSELDDFDCHCLISPNPE